MMIFFLGKLTKVYSCGLHLIGGGDPAPTQITWMPSMVSNAGISSGYMLSDDAISSRVSRLSSHLVFLR